MTKTAILFPGQGSQVKGMGKDAAQARPELMDLWKAAEAESGLPLREIYWDGEEADMADTRALQPALTVVNLSLWLCRKDSLSPAATAGHSLGEYASLAAAGVLSIPDTIKAVSVRGRLMAECGKPDHGRTAILKMERDAVEELVNTAMAETGTELRIANYNTPAQFVLSGQRAALDAAAALVKEYRGRAVPLAVSGAFHSPLILEAAEEFAGTLNKLGWNAPAFPVYFNATARAEEDPEKIRVTMVSQMTSSVQWIEIIENQYDHGVRAWLELGPKAVVGKMVGPILRGRDEIAVDAWTGCE